MRVWGLVGFLLTETTPRSGPSLPHHGAGFTQPTGRHADTCPLCQTHWPKPISRYVPLALSRLTTHFLVSVSAPSLSETLYLAEMTQEKRLL